MGLLANLLTLPVLGAPRLVHWLAGTVGQAALEELLDEAPLRAALLELQEQLDSGAIEPEEYDRQEGALLEQLNWARELRAHIAQPRQ